MEEKQKKVEEKPATHNKKAQVYLMATAGLIALALFLNFVISVNSKKEEVKEPVPGEQHESLKAQDLKSLLNQGERPAAASTGTGSDTARTTNPPADTSGREARRSPYSGERQGSRSSGLGEQNTPEKVRERFELEEVSRALRARFDRQNFSGAQPVPQGSAYAPRSHYQPQTNAEKAGRINGEQSDVDKKISELALQGRHHRAESQANLARARDNVSSAMHSLTTLPQQPAIPEGVVGYSRDNHYQASTEGMEKLPVGSVLNAITTMTAISDYQGGTMKAMLTSDMYDASNTYVLAPKGSEFIIKVVKASGVNEVIQNRLAFTVQWLVLPNGDRIDFSKSAGLDRMGVPAVQGDEVDRHILAQILGVTAYAIVGSKSSYAGTGDGEESMAGEVGSGLRGQAKNIAAKYLQIVPTVTLHAGAPIRIITEDEMFIYPWKNIYEENYYN